MTTGSFLFLGTGGSMGIPVIGCHCEVCQSESPCNKRLRPSALIHINNKKFLIDCGPDFRQQALNYHIDELDGLILTHTHHDHIAGIDELRIYYMRSKKSLPCLLSAASSLDFKTRYPFIFDEFPLNKKLTAKIVLHILEKEAGTIVFEDIPISYMTYSQAGMFVNGFRFGNLAYLSDISEYPETIFESLQGVETLIISALRYEPSLFHLSVDEAVAFSQKVKAKNTWFTHISHDLDHEKTNSYLPHNVRMAYDGLQLNFEI